MRLSEPENGNSCGEGGPKWKEDLGMNNAVSPGDPRRKDGRPKGKAQKKERGSNRHTGLNKNFSDQC